MKILKALRKIFRPNQCASAPNQKTTEEPNNRDNRSTELWDTIANKTCPACSKKNTFYVTAEGGMAMNIDCDNCNARYWITPVREFGAERLNSRT